MFRVEEPQSHQPMIIQVEVQGKQLSMELDTGAAVSIISSITKQQMFPAEQLLSTYYTDNLLWRADGSGWQDGSGGEV